MFALPFKNDINVLLDGEGQRAVKAGCLCLTAQGCVDCWFALAGHPSVTMAPKRESGSTMSESPLSVLSQTVLEQQAREEMLADI